MSATVDDDFRDFVVARWPELESVARVVVLDPGLARSTTTGALARLQRQWRQTVADGRPGEAARRAVLTAAVGAATRPGPREPAPQSAVDPWSVTPAVPSDGPWGDGAGDEPVVTALVEVIRSAPPVERAVLAAATLWGAGPDEVARLLGVPAATVHEREASVRSRLAVSYDGARAAAGVDASVGDRDHVLAAAVDVLLQGLGDPPDPTSLVAHRGRGLRRRALVAGGVASVALGGVGVVLARRATTATVAGPSAPPSVAPDDRRWASASRWPARGPLAADPALRSLLARRASPGDHVLWAGDLGTRRVALVWTRLPPESPGGTAVRVFDGRGGTDPAQLREVHLPSPVMTDTADVVALTLPDDGAGVADRSLLVVLARPTVTSASASYVVTPTADGRIERSWSPLPLETGVATAVMDRASPLALRLRVGTWEGYPVTPVSVLDLIASGRRPPTSPEWAEDPISALTGIPTDRLATAVHVDEAVPGALMFSDGDSRQGASAARLVSLLTTTPGGAVLRTTVYHDDGEAVAFEPALLIRAGTKDDPFVAQVTDLPSDVARFLVVAPGADRVQLIAASPDGDPVSKVHRTGGHDVTVVPVANGNQGWPFRVITRDRQGRVLFDGVPEPGRYLLDF